MTGWERSVALQWVTNTITMKALLSILSKSAVTRLPPTGVNFLEKKTFAADRVAYAFQIVLGGEYLN